MEPLVLEQVDRFQNKTKPVSHIAMLSYMCVFTLFVVAVTFKKWISSCNIVAGHQESIALPTTQLLEVYLAKLATDHHALQEACVLGWWWMGAGVWCSYKLHSTQRFA
jgi:hypothetical protein